MISNNATQTVIPKHRKLLDEGTPVEPRIILTELLDACPFGTGSTLARHLRTKSHRISFWKSGKEHIPDDKLPGIDEFFSTDGLLEDCAKFPKRALLQQHMDILNSVTQGPLLRPDYVIMRFLDLGDKTKILRLLGKDAKAYLPDTFSRPQAQIIDDFIVEKHGEEFRGAITGIVDHQEQMRATTLRYFIDSQKTALSRTPRQAERTGVLLRQLQAIKDIPDETIAEKLGCTNHTIRWMRHVGRVSFHHLKAVDELFETGTLFQDTARVVEHREPAPPKVKTPVTKLKHRPASVLDAWLEHGDARELAQHLGVTPPQIHRMRHGRITSLPWLDGIDEFFEQNRPDYPKGLMQRCKENGTLYTPSSDNTPPGTFATEVRAQPSISSVEKNVPKK